MSKTATKLLATTVTLWFVWFASGPFLDMNFTVWRYGMVVFICLLIAQYLMIIWKD